MAGGLTISTLNDSSGVLATQNGMSGIAKAWVQFNGVTTATIRGSFNVSSVTRNGTGDYTVNFTTTMPDANYSVVGTCAEGGAGNMTALGLLNGTAPTTSAVRVTTRYYTSSVVDSAYVSVVINR